MKTYDQNHPKYLFVKVLYSDTQDGVKLINEDGDSFTGGEALMDFVHTAKEKTENWIDVTKELPQPFERDGKRFMSPVLVCIEHTKKDGGKWYSHQVATYRPQFWKQCEWEDLDELDLDELEMENYHLERHENGEIYLMAGFWFEYEHRGDLFETFLENVVSWMPIAKSKPE